MARALDVLDEKADAVGFQEDLEWLNSELKKDPSKMKTIKHVVKMKKEVKWDKGSSFCPDLQGRSVSRVPQKHLTSKWFPALGDITCEEMTSLARVDGKAAHKMLYRLCCIEPVDPIGPLLLSEWNQMYMDRVELMKSELNMIKWNRNFVIDWQRSGHYRLHPELPDGASKDDHIFTHIIVFQHSVPLPDDIRFKGHWVVANNWGLKGAFLEDTRKPGMMKFPCFDLFDGTGACDKIEPMFLKDDVQSKAPKAILDGKVAPSLEAGASIADAALSSPDSKSSKSSGSSRPADESVSGGQGSLKASSPVPDAIQASAASSSSTGVAVKALGVKLPGVKKAPSKAPGHISRVSALQNEGKVVSIQS